MASENSFNALQSNTVAFGINSLLVSQTVNLSRNTFNKKIQKSKILNIKFQSIRNKKPELHTLLDTEHLGVICGKKSWLTPDISNNEIIPQDLGYTMFRQDRIGPIGGAVLILVKNDIIAFEQKQFQTDCEIVWIKVVLIGSTPLYSRTSMA